MSVVNPQTGRKIQIGGATYKKVFDRTGHSNRKDSRNQDQCTFCKKHGPETMLLFGSIYNP